MTNVRRILYVRALHPYLGKGILLLLCTHTILSCTDSSENTGILTNQEIREEQFRKSMSGVLLEGFFTSSADGQLSKERYYIAKVSKLVSDYWIFQARIQYGKHDVTVPVPVRIKWVGDTPVLTLTDATIPGLGIFSARVLFYDDHYVGVWRHEKISGQHFGRIIPDEGPVTQ